MALRAATVVTELMITKGPQNGINLLPAGSALYLVQVGLVLWPLLIFSADGYGIDSDLA